MNPAAVRGGKIELWAFRSNFSLRARFLWDPNPLILEMWLEPLGRGEVAGREGIRVRASWRETTHDFDVVWPWWADRYELVVDAERGILLSLAARIRGELLSVEEVLEVEFDSPKPESASMWST